MALETLYHIALVTHITGLALMAGTTLADYIVTRQFWVQYATDKPKAIAINQSISKLPAMAAIGILLLILSGVAMMGITKGVFGEQLWFRIKFALVLIIIINALAVGRRQSTRLKKLLTQDTADAEIKLPGVRKNLNLFHTIQIILFLLVFVLSVFKFN